MRTILALLLTTTLLTLNSLPTLASPLLIVKREGADPNNVKFDESACGAWTYPKKHKGNYTLANCTAAYESARKDCDDGDSTCTLQAMDRRKTCQALCHADDDNVVDCAKACAKNWSRFARQVCRPLKNKMGEKACAQIGDRQLETCQDICVKFAGANGDTSASAPAPGATNSPSASSSGDGSTDSSVEVTREGDFGDDDADDMNADDNNDNNNDTNSDDGGN
ncbi:hypothetical protein DFJ77DRAFT_510694 [Powellomyces hirtus]|nr:hypothetical protein DFJ77DRAFT_510694 [Powellomyces hirtus]